MNEDKLWHYPLLSIPFFILRAGNLCINSNVSVNRVKSDQQYLLGMTEVGTKKMSEKHVEGNEIKKE